MSTKPDQVAPLIAVLEETRALLARPDNDFSWSSWKDATEALREMDDLITRLRQGVLPARLALTVLFLATGPIQEVSVSSGWGDDFLTLANRFDSAINRVYGRDPQELAAHKAELTAQMHELFGGRARWIFTVLGFAATGFAVHLHYSHDEVEVYFPLHLKGADVFYAMVAAASIFGILAVINWLFWKKQKNLQARNIFPPPAK